MKQIRNYELLLVDDELILIQSLKHSIEQADEDFKVRAVASNGKEALKVLSDTEIHAVITDIRMPVMNGLELAKEIHQRRPDLPVILLTGYADFQYAREALRSSALDYLLKPISAEDLLAMLGHLREKLSENYHISDSSELSAGGTGGEESVLAVKEIFQTRYMEDLDLGTISQELGFSSAYLTKLFNKYVGETPLRFLTGIRISEAQRLLTETNLSIGEVGEQVGYPDQFHFSKTFRKLTGVTPSNYRKNPQA